VASAQPRCLYCGAALPAATQAAARAAAHAALGAPKQNASLKAFVVFDATGADVATLARALGLARFEAEQRRRRGGPQLQRILPVEEAQAEAARLVAAGLVAAAIPEAEALPARTPRMALAARPGADLELRLDSGTLRVAAPDLRLVVRGPIAREYQSRGSARNQVRMAGLEAGYRFHLHFVSEPRPVEIDPWACELGTGVAGSSLLTLSSWIKAATGGVPEDDGFRWLTPALAPEARAEGGIVSAAEPLRPRPSGKGGEAAVVLDNAAQFRVYSGWRAAFAARPRG
jgi:hypothetical protein